MLLLKFDQIFTSLDQD